MKVEASWDSTVHECPQLSRVTPAEQRVYLTVKAVVQLSHPANMQLVLRKRICVSVVGRQVGEWMMCCLSFRLSFHQQKKEDNLSWSWFTLCIVAGEPVSFHDSVIYHFMSLSNQDNYN